MTFPRSTFFIDVSSLFLLSAALWACGGDPSSSGGSNGAGASGGEGGAGASGGAGGAGGIAGMIVEPGEPGAADIAFEVRADTEQRRISSLIYGVNQPDDLAGAQRGAGLVRMGGNRLTAYNWENNASNAGTDYLNQNDDFLVFQLPSGGDTPGEAVRARAKAAFDAGASFLATVPIAGHVAADKNGGGDVNQTPGYLDKRFHPTLARKNAPFSTSPDLADHAVYQDEYVAFLKQAFPEAFTGAEARMLFSLDNEPDLWSSTHPRIHPDPVGYAELVAKNTEFAAAIKDVAPNALVTGFVSYGFLGYVTLQQAADQSGDFIEYYLDAMKAAETKAGKRLVDVLDLHWYPEVYANGQRITGDDTSPASASAREQAPRSLWDPTYKEDSWIANDYLAGPISLVRGVQSKIDAHYPGTGIGFTEYWYGGGDHISGAIAEADVLGIFGREGVRLATAWTLSDKTAMINAALRMYTSYDGNGAHFGDTSVRASTSDVEKATVYASVDQANPSRMVLVAINKTDAPLSAAVKLAAYEKYGAVNVFTLDASGPSIEAAPEFTLPATNAFVYQMPPQSISVLVPKN